MFRYNRELMRYIWGNFPWVFKMDNYDKGINSRSVLFTYTQEENKMNKYQERTVYITSGILIFFLVISLITNDLGFFLVSLIPVFINLMFAFFAKKNKFYKDLIKDIPRN